VSPTKKKVRFGRWDVIDVTVTKVLLEKVYELEELIIWNM
jgi:hypothetical protein